MYEQMMSGAALAIVVRSPVFEKSEKFKRDRERITKDKIPVIQLLLDTINWQPTPMSELGSPYVTTT